MLLLIYDAGVEARANLGKVTIAKGVTVSDDFKRVLSRVAKDLHTHITYGGTAPTRNGVTERGYSTKYGELHIYADAKVKGANGTTLYGERAAAVIIAGHEMTHRLQQLAPSEYAAFRDYAVAQSGGDKAVARYMRKYDLDETDAMDEIAADYAMKKLFFDEKTIAQITKKHSKLAQAIRNILAWIREKLHLSSDIDRAIRLWNDAYNAASRNAKNPQVHNDIAQKKNADSDTGEGVKFSVSMDDVQAQDVIDSFNIEESRLGDYIYVQKRVLQTLIDEDFFTDKDIRSRTDVNAESGMIIETNKSGVNETFNYDNYGRRGKQLKLFKLATIRKIPDVIKNGHLLSSENTNIHGAQHTTKYAYIEDSVIVADKEITIKISIRQSAQKNKFWVHNVYLDEKTTGQDAGTSKSSKTPYKTDGKDTIPQSTEFVKQKQLEIINSTNPAPDTYHTWVRSVEDILTFKEALASDEYDGYDTFNPDYTREMANAAIASGEITVYSSYPIKNGVFVTPSAMEAQSYSGDGTLYSKKVKLGDVAWIDVTQGQYAKVDDTKSKSDAKSSLAGGEDMIAELEAMEEREKNTASSVARKLVQREEGARASGRRYTMSLDTFEQVAREYAAQYTGDAETEKKFTKKLFDASVNLAAAWRSHGDAKAAFYREAWRGMQSAARVLEKDTEAALDLAEEMTVAMIEGGYMGKASTQTVRDTFMTTQQAKMDAALFQGKKVSLAEVVLRRENFKKDEKIAALLKNNKVLRQKADEIRVRGEVQAEYRKKYSDWKEAYKESDTVQKQRARIEKNMTALYKWSVKPDKKGHSIPEAAREPILKLLGRINMIKNGEGMEPSLHDIQWHERLFDIANALYARETLEKQKEDGTLPDTVHGFIPIAQIERIHIAADAIGKADVYDMRGDELRALDEALCVLKKMVVDANEMHLEGRTVELETVAEEEMKRLDRTPKNKAKRIAYDTMDSFTYAEHVGGLFGKLVHKLRDSFDVFVRATADVQDFTSKTVEEKEVRQWRRTVKEVKLGARKVYMTDTQIMSLYLLSKRPQAEGHIYGHGIRIDHAAIRKSGNADAIAWANDTKEQSFGAITKADVEEAITLLSPRQRDVADKFQRFMADELGGMGNEVTMTLYGFRAFTEKHYFPIKTVIQWNKKTPATDNVDHIFSILTAGMTKNTVEGANNPIVIGDMFSTFNAHASDIVNYYAYAEAISDCMRVYNYKSEGGTLTEVLKATYEGAENYFENLIRSVNSQKAFARTETDKWLKKATGNAKAAMVGANLRVILQQPSAILRAAAIMDPKYFTPGKTVKRVSLDKVRQYCPIAQWKSWGFYDLDIGGSLDSILFGEQTVLDKIKDKQMWLAGKADEMTWAMLWNACEAEIKDKNKDLKVGTEEFNQAVGKRLSQVIDETQVVDSPFHRAQVMRSGNEVAKAALSFQSESLKSVNLLYRAIGRGKKPAFRTFLAIEASMIAAAVGAGIADALRDDDDEKNLVEKYLSNTAENIMDYTNPLGWVPFAADLTTAGTKILFALTDKMLGANLADKVPRVFDQSRYDMMLITELIDLGETLASEGASWYDGLYATLKVADMSTGVGWSNAFRDTVGTIINLANGVSPKGAYKKVLALGDEEKVAANYNAFLHAKCEELAKSKYGTTYAELGKEDQRKVRKSAHSSIQATTKALFEEDYIKAWQKGDDAAITRIRSALLATDVYDMNDIRDFFKSFVKSYYKDLYKKAKTAEEKEAVIKEAAKSRAKLIGDMRVFSSYSDARKYMTS